MRIWLECLRTLRRLADLPQLEVDIALYDAVRAVLNGSIDVVWKSDEELELVRARTVRRFFARHPDEITLREARRGFSGDVEVGDELLFPLVPNEPEEQMLRALQEFEASGLYQRVADTLVRVAGRWIPSDTRSQICVALETGWSVCCRLSLEMPRLDSPSPYTLWQAAAEDLDFDALRAPYVGSDVLGVAARIDYVVGQVHNGGVSQLVYNGLRARVSMSGLCDALHEVGVSQAAKRLGDMLELLDGNEMTEFLRSDYFGENAERDELERASKDLAAAIPAIERESAWWLWERRHDPVLASALASARRPQTDEAVRAAIERDDTNELERLRELGTPFDDLGPHRSDILSAACERPDAMRFLLRAGFDPVSASCSRGDVLGAPRCRDVFLDHGYTPGPPWTHELADSSSVEEIDAMLSNGIVPGAEELAKMAWSLGRDPEVTRHLLSRCREVGVRIADATDGGAQALCNALDRPTLVDALLDHGVDPNAPLRSGGVALHHVEDPVVLERLVAAGADVDRAADRTIAIYAHDSMRFLPPGSTPLDVAEALGNSEVATALRGRGAKPGTRRSWGIVVRSRGSHDRRLLDCLGDSPGTREKLARTPRTGDDPLDGEVVAEVATREEAIALREELARLGATADVI